MMSTHTLRLQKFSGNSGNDGTLPYGPRAYIALKSYSPMKLPSKPGGKEVDFKALSSQCMAFGEIDWEVNRLIQELQTIRKQAKAFFQKEQSNR